MQPNVNSSPASVVADAKARLQGILGVTKESLEREASELGDLLDKLKFMGSTTAEVDTMLAEVRVVLMRTGIPPAAIGFHHLADAYAEMCVAREKLASG